MGHVDRQLHAAGGRGDLAEQEAARDIMGDFGAADDLLWQAEGGRLLSIGQIRILRSGRIGPIVEMAMASHAHPDAYARTSFDAPFARSRARRYRPWGR